MKIELTKEDLLKDATGDSLFDFKIGLVHMTKAEIIVYNDGKTIRVLKDRNKSYEKNQLFQKTAMQLALARIELMKDIRPDSIHWEMFKDHYIEMEKQQMLAFTEWIFNHRLDFQPTNKKGMLIGLDMKNHFINDLLIEYYNQTYKK